MKLIIISLIIALLVVPGAAQAVLPTYTCKDSTALVTEMQINKTVNGSTTTYMFNQTIPCPFGCENDLGKYGADCIQPGYIITIEVIAFVLILFGIGAVVVGRGRRR